MFALAAATAPASVVFGCYAVVESPSVLNDGTDRVFFSAIV